MRKKILPVGSVICLEKKYFMITGYRPIEKEGAVAVGYILFPWPLGYLNRQSVFLCPVSEVREALAEGYRGEAGEHFLDKMADIEEKGKKANYKELMKFMRIVKEKSEDREDG